MISYILENPKLVVFYQYCFIYFYFDQKISHHQKMIQMPRESLLSILQKEMKHDFPILSFNHQLTTKVMLSDNFRKWIFGFGMGDLFNSGFCNLGKLGRKICPVGNTRMFYLLKEKKKQRFVFFLSCMNRVLTILWCFTSIHLGKVFISSLFWIVSKENYDTSFYQ